MKNVSKFFLNGNEYVSTKQISLNDLIYYFNCQNLVFVLEYNALVCPRKNWKKILIKNNDQIDLITIVGGG